MFFVRCCDPCPLAWDHLETDFADDDNVTVLFGMVDLYLVIMR